MRIIYILFFVSTFGFLHAQENRVPFDNQSMLNEGIYTCFTEIIENCPKYQNCIFEVKIDYWFGGSAIYYMDRLGVKKELNDTIYLVVNQGIRYILFSNQFHRLINTGTVSTFILGSIYRIYGNDYKLEDLYFWDIQTGKMGLLTPGHIDEVFKRDNALYQDFSKLSNSKKKKMVYAYLLRFNQRNTVFIANK